MLTVSLRLLLHVGLAAGYALLTGCAVGSNVAQFNDGQYRLVRRLSPDSLVTATAQVKRFYVRQRADTLLLMPLDSASRSSTYRYRLNASQPVWLLRRHLDFDVLTIPFKVRPGQGSLPVQLNTGFNAAIYLGQRLDFYSLRTKRMSPFGLTPRTQYTGLGYGAFLGAGSTLINAGVTGQQVRGPEHTGFVVHGGVAGLYDARLLNIGLAIGVDQLLGADGRYWVYQHKPWFGILLGLDLN